MISVATKLSNFPTVDSALITACFNRLAFWDVAIGRRRYKQQISSSTTHNTITFNLKSAWKPLENSYIILDRQYEDPAIQLDRSFSAQHGDGREEAWSGEERKRGKHVMLHYSCGRTPTVTAA